MASLEPLATFDVRSAVALQAGFVHWKPEPPEPPRGTYDDYSMMKTYYITIMIIMIMIMILFIIYNII